MNNSERVTRAGVASLEYVRGLAIAQAMKRQLRKARKRK